jgi:GH24 family phage-related lysozyme (muramidase)
LSGKRNKPIDRLPSDDIKDSLKTSEGFEAKPYNDSAGHCTIGYGHLLHKGACTDEDFENHKDGWTEDYANKVFDKDIIEHEEDVKKHVKVDLTQGEYDALVHFAYNIGGDEFKNSTLLEKLNAGDYNSVPEEMRRWINITVNGKKQESEGLKKRREREIEMYKKK